MTNEEIDDYCTAALLADCSVTETQFYEAVQALVRAKD
jgi:hypothetical protein